MKHKYSYSKLTGRQRDGAFYLNLSVVFEWPKYTSAWTKNNLQTILKNCFFHKKQLTVYSVTNPDDRKDNLLLNVNIVFLTCKYQKRNTFAFNVLGCHQNLGDRKKYVSALLERNCDVGRPCSRGQNLEFNLDVIKEMERDNETEHARWRDLLARWEHICEIRQLKAFIAVKMSYWSGQSLMKRQKFQGLGAGKFKFIQHTSHTLICRDHTGGSNCFLHLRITLTSVMEHCTEIISKIKVGLWSRWDKQLVVHCISWLIGI